MKDADTAYRVADRLRGHRPRPWDVYGERLRRYEVHLVGRSVEMRRGPICLEGYGIRDFDLRENGIGVGFSASSDLSGPGIGRTVDSAEASGRPSAFPAKSLDLPSETGTLSEVATVDPALWERPEEVVDRLADGLLRPFEGRSDVVPSFGSVRATLSEATLANSAGLEHSSRHTRVEIELAVTALAGPEGPGRGEYWVNLSAGRVTPQELSVAASEWARKARDARRATAPPNGQFRAALPVAVLSEILPAILGYRLAGSAALQGMMPKLGSPVARPNLTVLDDPFVPNALGSAACDDEGSAARRSTLIRDGALAEPLYDLLHASALQQHPTGSGRRDLSLVQSWFRFASPPYPGPSTLTVPAGPSGSDAEVAEAIGDGVWIDQLGYAFPDARSSAWGGEVRLGYRIRGGKIAEPFRGGTAGGVVLAAPGEPSLLNSAGWIGSVPTLSNRLLAPTIGLEELAIAGA